MKNKINAALVAALILAPLAYASADAGLGKRLQAAAAKDTVCNVWVFFKDRSPTGAIKVSERAAQKRRRANFREDGESGRPVNQRYISEVERRGGKHRRTLSWENAASFSVHSSKLSEIASLPFVSSVRPVGVYIGRGVDGSPGPLGKTRAYSPLTDPGYDWHAEMVNIHLAHAYLRLKKLGDPGSGVFMAFFDSGFRLEHRAFSYIVDSASVVSTRDYVDGDTLVHNPDSIFKNVNHEYYQSDKHGTQVLGLVAGYHPGHYMGAAWGARFALARTEDVTVESRVEEDNWAAAVEWAVDSLGVDIISSSLGYRDEFDDPYEDYSYRDMDGKTTIVSRAAAGALARGVTVVNSMGNEGSGKDSTLTAPADVDGVVSVGAVDRNRAVTIFSSTGPTFDGRMKPDVVAPGQSVKLANPYSADPAAYNSASGTSFSAPIVAGIMALIYQANPGITSEEARQRLYRSCAYAPRQEFPNNKYGYGIPNALRAIMGPNEIFAYIADSAGRPLAGAQVKAGAETYTVDTTGMLLIEKRPETLPIKCVVFFREKEVAMFTVDSLPFAEIISAEVNREDGLKVRPNIVRKNSMIRGKYLFAGLDASAPATAIVRTINGKKVWEQKLRIYPDGTAEFAWNCKNGPRKVAAGVYFVTIMHGNHMISEKFIVGY